MFAVLKYQLTSFHADHTCHSITQKYPQTRVNERKLIFLSEVTQVVSKDKISMIHFSSITPFQKESKNIKSSETPQLYELVNTGLDMQQLDVGSHLLQQALPVPAATGCVYQHPVFPQCNICG